MASRYPIRAVAKITGLSLDTLRAWERRYQAVVPERSDRGRQYSEADVGRLLLLGQLVQKGHAIGGVATLADSELRLILGHTPDRTSSDPAPEGALLAPVLRAIESFDAARAGDELSRLAAVLSPRDLVYQVAVPLMREVGIRWHKGTLAIAQEHLVSQLLRNLLGSMMRLFRPPAGAIKMVMATPAGESHEFGILAAAMLASMAGIEPICLGPNLPAGEIAAAAERTGARVVVLGITASSGDLGDEMMALSAALPADVELWIGGEGVAGLELSSLGRRLVVVKNLAALESECVALRKLTQ